MSRLTTAKVILYFCLLAVLDSAVMPAFQIFSVYPSFLLLFVCYAAFEWGAAKTIYVAFWAGLARDFLGGGVIGLDAFILVLLAPALDFLVQKMERQMSGMYFLMTFLFVFFAELLLLLVSYATEWSSAIVWGHVGRIVGEALYTSALLPLFNLITHGWFGRSITKQYELFR